MTMSLPTPEFRAARSSLLAIALAGLLAACGNSGGAKTRDGGTAPTVAARAGHRHRAASIRPARRWKTLGREIDNGAGRLPAALRRRRPPGHAGPAPQRAREALRPASDAADQAVAAAAAASPARRDGLRLHRPARRDAAAGDSSCTTPPRPRRRRRWPASSATSGRSTGSTARSLRPSSRSTPRPRSSASRPPRSSPTSPPAAPGTSSSRPAASARLRDQFTALSAAAKKKQAAKAAGAADAIRAVDAPGAERHGAGLAKTNPPAVSRAATALRDLAGLEARVHGAGRPLVAEQDRFRRPPASARGGDPERLQARRRPRQAQRRLVLLQVPLGVVVDDRRGRRLGLAPDRDAEQLGRAAAARRRRGSRPASPTRSSRRTRRTPPPARVPQSGHASSAGIVTPTRYRRP